MVTKMELRRSGARAVQSLRGERRLTPAPSTEENCGGAGGELDERE
jgi:hypothetical protein